MGLVLRVRHAAYLILALWVLHLALASLALAQEYEVRASEVAIPQPMVIPAPEGLKPFFPRGFTPGLGFGLSCAQAQAGGTMILHTLTGRGPALPGPMLAGKYGQARSCLFVLPGFDPAIVTMKLLGDKAEVIGMLPLKDAEGHALSGLPPTPMVTGIPPEIPLDRSLKHLEFDNQGIDPRGVAYDFKRGVFWLADGYRPAIFSVSPRDGRVRVMFAPGAGLEDLLAMHGPGRGFSGISVSPTGKVYTIMRGVLDLNGTSAKFSRIVEVDPDTERVRQLPYPVEEDIFADPSQVITAEPVAFGDKRLLVLEQGTDKEGRPRSLVFAADLTRASNINRVYDDAGNPPETVTDKAQLVKMDIRPARKTLVMDLQQGGFKGDMAESMTLLSDGRTLAFMSGHSFGAQGQMTDFATSSDGSPVIDPGQYTLGEDGKLTFAGRPTQAVISFRPEREAPRLWMVTLPKKVSDY